MNAILKTILPPVLVDACRHVRQRAEDRRNARRSAQEVFSDVYRRAAWGSRSDGTGSSGFGSADPMVTEPYVDLIRRFLQSNGSDVTVVDLGCGDYQIGRRLVPFCGRYIGVDVVPELIERHRRENTAANVDFCCLDIAQDELPAGDVCLVRQVLQHLSNREISRVVDKLSQYRCTFVTEHQPTSSSRVVPNRDIVHGGRIRLLDNSGVYLDETPFDIPSNRMRVVLEVPGTGAEYQGDRGVIRTYQLCFVDEEPKACSPTCR